MPIFARTKLVIHDDCIGRIPGSALPGRTWITLNYSGPNPQKIYPEVKKLLSSVMKFDEKDIQEKDFFWDRSGPEERFSINIEANEDLDRFSFMHVVVGIKGVARPSEEFGKEGEAEIKIEAHIRTEYPADTLWQRTLFYEFFRMFFHKVIYKSTRQRYLERCTALVNQFQEELKKFLNILASG